LRNLPHLRQTRSNVKFSWSCLLGALFLIVFFGLEAFTAGAPSSQEQEGVAAVPRSPLAEARDLLAAGRIQEAENTARQYLSEHKTSADAHFLLGLIFFRQIQAEALDGRASPTDGSSQTSLGSRKFREENAKASLAEYTEGAKYARPGAADLKIVALDYVLLGSYADASKWLARSVADDPNDAEAWYFLGRAKYNENRFDEAISAFERSLALEPRNIKAQSNLGLSYAGLNRVPEAQGAFLKAIEWQAGALRKDPEAYIGLGDLLVQQNRASEAVPYLLEAIQIAPRESRAREKLGSAYLNLNELAAAQEELESAVALDPRNSELHYLLGSVYRKQGQAEKAKAEFERFQTLKKTMETARP
jgi:tetratricopeptide (TPR) repeat protein